MKPESELFFHNKLQNLANSDYVNRLAKMNSTEIQKEFTKYGLTNMDELQKTENDYYKSWLEQNGELEVSLLKSTKKTTKKIDSQKSEIELISKVDKGDKGDKVIKRRGRPPIFKDRSVDLSEGALKADLEQFLAGAEVSSSGLSRQELERAMMGKFNPNRRYSNEAMWAALMDVKRGGSIYRSVLTPHTSLTPLTLLTPLSPLNPLTPLSSLTPLTPLTPLLRT